MESTAPLARLQTDDDLTVAITSPAQDQFLPTTKAGLRDYQNALNSHHDRLERANQRTAVVTSLGIRAYQTDMNAQSDRLERVTQGATEFASRELQAHRADMNAQSNRLERFTHAALKLFSKSTQNAHELVKQSEQTTLAAVSSNQQVSLAAIQTAHQGTESLERIALDAQSMARQVIQSTAADTKLRSEEERKTRRDEKLEELLKERAIWEMILKPDTTQAAIVELARAKIVALTKLEQNLVGQKQREAEQEDQFFRERTEAANRRLALDTLRSRTEKLTLAKTSIEQSLSSFDIKRVYLPLLLSCATVVCIASYYFGDRRATAIAITLGCVVFAEEFYRTGFYYSDFSNRKKWLCVYIKALERLKNEPQLTVRSAVQEILDNDLSIGVAQKNSPITQRILSQIRDEPLIGDPDEITTTIPRALAFLVDHATRQPLKSFSEL